MDSENKQGRYNVVSGSPQGKNVMKSIALWKVDHLYYFYISK